MKVIKAEKTHYFDVDDSLILWNHSPEGSSYPSYTPNTLLIRELKAASDRGHYVVVWSAGGWRWAKFIVTKLELAGYVDEVRSKPDWIWDDKKPEEWSRLCYRK